MAGLFEKYCSLPARQPRYQNVVRSAQRLEGLSTNHPLFFELLREKTFLHTNESIHLFPWEYLSQEEQN